MSTRTPFVAGNWKLQKTIAEALELVTALRTELGDDLSGVQVAVAPVATALSSVAGALEGSTIGLSAQNCYQEPSGAFTGEISPALLKDAGCSLCIVGHSERRQIFGETDEGVRRKTRALIDEGIAPIVCVGETLEEREAGETLGVVLGQLSAALEGISAAEMATVVVAYEPVWAIGTGKTATPDDAQSVHAAIRARVEEEKGAQVANSLRILYGGSVKPANATELLAQADIDGALVGGASLKAELFVPIVRAALS